MISYNALLLFQITALDSFHEIGKDLLWLSLQVNKINLLGPLHLFTIL